jgi:endonuclease V-like protein UPF0215 family
MSEFEKVTKEKLSEIITALEKELNLKGFRFDIGLTVYSYESCGRQFQYKYKGRSVTREEAKEILRRHKTKIGGLF